MRIKITAVLLIMTVMLTVGCTRQNEPSGPVYLPAGEYPFVTETPTKKPTRQPTPIPTYAPLPEIDVLEIPSDDELLNIGSLELTSMIDVGWNLGNTLDAESSEYVRSDMRLEYEWVGVKTNKEMILAVYEQGFNAIRIPISWHNHVDSNFTINSKWMDRVQEIVDYAYDLGMFVIINTHHDVYPEYYYPDSTHLKSSEKYVSAIWSQVAERFKNYDCHLIFEGLNEPRLKGTDIEWRVDDGSPESVDSIECINALNQAFVDTVRASEGYNTVRFLMVSGYDASPDGALDKNFQLPADTVSDRLLVSVHAYTPYNFALQPAAESGSTSDFDSASKASTNDIDSTMSRIYDGFVSKGIGVIITEFGALDKNGNLVDRVDYAGYYVSTARNNSIPCFWWDNGAFTGTGELFGILDRKTCEFNPVEIADVLVEKCKQK